MSSGIYLTARLGSSRLPRKHIQPVGGVPIFSILIERIRAEFSREIAENQADLVITTTDDPENAAFEQFFPLGVAVFYGAKSNIPLRHLQTMEKFGHEWALSIDGDDILCSPAAMRAVWNGLAGGCDFVKTTGLPLGMNATGYTRTLLETSLKGRSTDTLETGWGRIFAPKNASTVPFQPISSNPLLRFTLDYQEDLAFFSALAERLGLNLARATGPEIVAEVERLGLDSINRAVAEEYWNNFRRQMERENKENA